MQFEVQLTVWSASAFLQTHTREYNKFSERASCRWWPFESDRGQRKSECHDDRRTRIVLESTEIKENKRHILIGCGSRIRQFRINKIILHFERMRTTCSCICTELQDRVPTFCDSNTFNSHTRCDDQQILCNWNQMKWIIGVHLNSGPHHN